jgi:hypothetical protein
MAMITRRQCADGAVRHAEISGSLMRFRGACCGGHRHGRMSLSHHSVARLPRPWVRRAIVAEMCNYDTLSRLTQCSVQSQCHTTTVTVAPWVFRAL